MPSPLQLLRKHLEQASRRYLHQLDEKQRDALELYQQGPFISNVEVNTALREGRSVPKSVLRSLDELLAGAPRLPEDIRVYRGAPHGVYPGEEKAYLSTTLDKNVARHWPLFETGSPGNMYSIDVVGDTPFVMPLDIVEDFAHQSELILPRGAMLLQEPSTGALNYLRGKYSHGGRV